MMPKTGAKSKDPPAWRKINLVIKTICSKFQAMVRQRTQYFHLFFYENCAKTGYSQGSDSQFI